MRVYFPPIAVLLAVLVPGAGLTAAHADTYMKQVRQTEAMQVMGQQVPASNETSILWFGDGRARMDTGEKMSVILRADRNLIYILNHGDRTYMEMPLDGKNMMEGMMPEGEDGAQAAEMMKNMMSSMMQETKATVTPTDERKKFRDWNARKYVVEITLPMGTTTSEVWASKDIKVDTHMFHQLSTAMMSMMGGAEKITKEMEKIEGVEVYSTSSASMMGSTTKSTQELVEYGEKSPPAGTYDLPEGYRKATMMGG